MDNLSDLVRNIESGAAGLSGASEVLNVIQPVEFHSFLHWLAEIAVGDDSNKETIWPVILAAIFQRKNSADEPFQFDESAALRLLYTNLGPHRDQRYHLLARLARSASRVNLETFADLIVDDPPMAIGSVSAPFLPLFSGDKELDVNALFPRLFGGLGNPALAPPIMDLANYLTRSGATNKHPAAERVDHLLQLVEAVVANLSTLQSKPAESPAELRQKQLAVANSLPLAVSLCDALALIGDDRAIPKLTRMAELKHRRLRVEAAAAIIRLEQSADPDAIVQPLQPKDADEEGEKPSEAVLMLASMAAEPVVRLRAIAYAEELGITEQLAFEHRSPIAVAEAELTSYLAEPMQMGMPPMACELIDSRVLHWPGYEEPRNCYLFQFSYVVAVDESQPATPYTSIGIAGPLVHAFHADIAHLPHENKYAAFAGYQGEHEDIQEYDLTNTTLRSSPQSIVDSLADKLARAGYDDVEPQIFATFFGEPVIVAKATNENTAPGIVVIDEDEKEDWYPHVGTSRPVGPAEAWYIYKGRRLLRSFNSDDFDG